MRSKELLYFQTLLFADILLFGVDSGVYPFSKVALIFLQSIPINKYLTPFILDTGETGILASMEYRIFIKTKLNIQNEKNPDTICIHRYGIIH